MPKLLVILHLYYQNQLPYFLRQLAHIPIPYDLYVSGVNLSRKSIAKLQQFHPQVKIFPVDNVGYDTWPFLQVIYQTNLSNYDYILKLHTKRMNLIRFHGVWVNWNKLLVRPLLGSATIVKTNLELLTSQNAGLLASEPCRYTREEQFPDEMARFHKIRTHLHLQADSRTFVAGTMFFIKASCLIPLQKYPFSPADFSVSGKSGQRGTFSHMLELIFTVLVAEENLPVIWRPDARFNRLQAIRHFIHHLCTVTNEGPQKVLYLLGLRFVLCAKEKNK